MRVAKDLLAQLALLATGVALSAMGVMAFLDEDGFSSPYEAIGWGVLGVAGAICLALFAAIRYTYAHLPVVIAPQENQNEREPQRKVEVAEGELRCPICKSTNVLADDSHVYCLDCGAISRLIKMRRVRK